MNNQYQPIDVDKAAYAGNDEGYQITLITAYQLGEDATIETPWGEALLKADTYLVTNAAGEMFGLDPASFEREYKPAEN
jgi:hypothetical protein